jgi:hypothetical protein
LLFGLLFLVTSCGALKLSPTGCPGDGVWSANTIDGKQSAELSFTEDYYIWNMDYEVRLKDFLKKRNIDCREIKKMRVNIKSVFFVKRELTVFIQK